MYIYIYMRMFVCIHVCLYVHMYVCIYVQIWVNSVEPLKSLFKFVSKTALKAGPWQNCMQLIQERLCVRCSVD